MTQTAAEKSLRCVRCGFCLDSCPTFRLTGNEADSPRGRIYLMRSVWEKKISLDSGVVQHIDSCLGCRACETACPSGVEYGHLLETFRSEIEASPERSSMSKFARRTLLDTLTSPAKLKAALAGGALMERLGMGGTIPGPIAKLLTGESTPVPLPAVPENRDLRPLPEWSMAIGTRRATVAILPGCVMKVLYQGVNRATLNVLQQNGCDVWAPPALGCCGALHLHAGFADEAKKRARQVVQILTEKPFDALVVNSAGCGSMLHEVGELLADDPVWAEAAVKLAERVVDVSVFLDRLRLVPPAGAFRYKVTYHDACHLAHGQGVRAEPRNLLKAIPGVELVELPDADTCCGSAGTYNLTQPRMASAFLANKLDAILSTGAEVVAAGNPGCLAWIEHGAQERGNTLRLMHPVEILNEAYNGRVASG